MPHLNLTEHISIVVKCVITYVTFGCGYNKLIMQAVFCVVVDVIGACVKCVNV